VATASHTTTPQPLAPPLHCEQRSKKAVEVRGGCEARATHSLLACALAVGAGTAAGHRSGRRFCVGEVLPIFAVPDVPRLGGFGAGMCDLNR
jgi:hypothetical protein